MDNSIGFQSSQKVTHKYKLLFIPKTRLCWAFTCKKKKFVYRVNEYSIPQVTNRPMYNIASAVTRRTLAIVRSLPLPGCVFCHLIISVLTRQSNLFDFGKAFKEFIPSSETPVSTRSRSPKIQRKIKHFAIISESR